MASTGGLHSSTPVNIAGFSSARAGSTAAGTAALAAGTAALAASTVLAVTASIAAVTAVVKAAPVASRSVPAADRAGPATNTQPVTADTTDLLAHMPANSTEFLSSLLGDLDSISNCRDVTELQSIVQTLLSKHMQQDEELSCKGRALQKHQAEPSKLVPADRAVTLTALCPWWQLWAAP
ncbi:hypothetical protein WJX77_010264 [Trebouxia sp. C0004]